MIGSEYTQKIKDVLTRQIKDINQVRGSVMCVKVRSDNQIIVFDDGRFAVFYIDDDPDDMRILLEKGGFEPYLLHIAGLLTAEDWNEQQDLDAKHSKESELKTWRYYLDKFGTDPDNPKEI